MAHIHGSSDCEDKILKACEDDIKSIEELDLNYNGLNYEKKRKKEEFLKKLPDYIVGEQHEVFKLKKEKESILKKKKEKINLVQDKIKSQEWYLKPLSYLKIFYLKYITQSFSTKKLNSNIKDLKKNIEKLKKNPLDIFNEQNEELIDKVEHYESLKKQKHYHGGKGEKKVLSKLSELNDNYHIFMNRYIELNDWISYRGNKNLGSAQMDIVVVCKK